MKNSNKLDHITALLETARQETFDVRRHGDEVLREAQRLIGDAILLVNSAKPAPKPNPGQGYVDQFSVGK